MTRVKKKSKQSKPSLFLPVSRNRVSGKERARDREKERERRALDRVLSELRFPASPRSERKKASSHPSETRVCVLMNHTWPSCNVQRRSDIQHDQLSSTSTKSTCSCSLVWLAWRIHFPFASRIRTSLASAFVSRYCDDVLGNYHFILFQHGLFYQKHPAVLAGCLAGFSMYFFFFFISAASNARNPVLEKSSRMYWRESLFFISQL